MSEHRVRSAGCGESSRATRPAATPPDEKRAPRPASMSASVMRASDGAPGAGRAALADDSAATPGEQPSQRATNSAPPSQTANRMTRAMRIARQSLLPAARRRRDQQGGALQSVTEHQRRLVRQCAPRAVQCTSRRRNSSEKGTRNFSRRQQPDPVAQRRAIGTQRQRDQPGAAAEQASTATGG